MGEALRARQGRQEEEQLSGTTEQRHPSRQHQRGASVHRARAPGGEERGIAFREGREKERYGASASCAMSTAHRTTQLLCPGAGGAALCIYGVYIQYIHIHS